MGGHQKKWLKETLQSISPHAQWILANYHRPAWPSVKFPSGAKNHWVPLFDQFFLDFVYESDGHTLKVTVPILHDQVDHKKGVIYLGEGGLGVKQRYPFKKWSWYFKSPGFTRKAHHIMMLTVSESVLMNQVVSDAGQILHTLKRPPKKHLRMP
tara:strand:- start:120 stop:581 length:462 start_codon:yes stop_codon:yes gene_type:complete